jgi:RHS repeat-associated protein
MRDVPGDSKRSSEAPITNAGPAPGTAGAGSPPPSAAQQPPPAPPLLPSISLPKGGGAIRGIGEKFSSHPATGTGSLSLPIATSAGRAGFELGLQLAYDSGNGNGPFGLGWQLGTPSVTRKTDKGLPRYAGDDDPDVFVLSGAEDLVPVRLGIGAGASLDRFERGVYRVQRYRPRTEGLFARIERWTHQSTGDVHWRATTRDNVLNVYGRTPAARIADPEHPERIFSWLLEETRDDRGNIARYGYKAEDGAGVDAARASEGHRFAPATRQFSTTAQRYLKRIFYGNRIPVPDREAPAPDEDGPVAPVGNASWLFEVVFDYGEHDTAHPTPAEVTPWALRSDPFSSYRAGFEVRTYRLCRRVLMFHRFAELGATPCLVRSTDFVHEAVGVRSLDGSYDAGTAVTQLVSVTAAGYQRDPSSGAYTRATLPALDLGYARPILHDQLRAIDRESLRNVNGGVGGASAQWVDLDGEGLPGVLIPAERAWLYKANLGEGKLAPAVLERSLPAPAELQGGTQQLSDLGSDGNLDLVRYTAPLAGYFERTPERGWAPFVALPRLPKIDWNDPNLRFLDLDGDGLADALITEREAFVWYRSRAKDGFDRAAIVSKSQDELQGPAVVFADGTESIQLADMSGDGLVDIVRVRSNDVCYWPNLGYGRFGRKVTLDGAPRFDTPEQFDPKRIRFADIDGSGTNDIVYSGRDGVRVYFNRSGNALSAPRLFCSLPPVDSLSSLSVVDLLGQGTACLVWSSPSPGHADHSVFYLDLMGGKKPHLLESVKNNFGAETRIAYATSTEFYLRDKAAGRPWLTRLAFPVQVIERIERHDFIAQSKLVTRFAYHHGFFDGEEREFRGFACVEQWDAETLAGEKGQGLFPELPYDVDAGDAALNLPPVRTVTWFHTGAWLDRERLERALAREYYGHDAAAPLLPDTTLPAGLSVREQREAARALRGQILRQEIYAEDGSTEAAHPYTVSERDYTVRLHQRAAGQANAVFFVHPSDTISLHYERKSNDPRLQHELVLQVDDFGNVTRSATLGYPRRVPAEPEQARLWATLTEHRFANRPDESDWYRIGVPLETTTSELTGLVAPARGVLSAEEVETKASAAAEIPYEASATAGVQRRVVERQRQLYHREYATLDQYWADALGPLPPGEIGPHALPHQLLRQAFTPGLVAQVYGTRVDAQMLQSEGRYVQRDGLWWTLSGRTVPDPSRFFLPAGAVDAFGARHLVRQDAYSLLLLEAEDPLGNRVTAGLRDPSGNITANGNDYRVLAPALLSDPNRNRTRVEFDALGMVAQLWQLGRAGANEGDDDANAGVTFRYDLHAWRQSRGPSFAHVATREAHRLGGAPFEADGSPRRAGFQHGRTYSDGSGREVLKKVQAESGAVPIRKAGGGLERNPDGSPRLRQEPNRWVGTGRTVFDNKGNPVKKYEPFFSDTLGYEGETYLLEWGVTPVLRYDPLGRLVRTDQPHGAYAVTRFDSWRQDTWDENDTLADSAWFARWKQVPEGATQLLPFVRSFVPSWTRSPTDHECAGELCRVLTLPPPSAADMSWLAAPAGPVPPLWTNVLSRAKQTQRAAQLSANHASTPSVAHLDPLGRVFLTVSDNGTDSNGNERKYRTRVELDVEGNQRSVTDARGIRVLVQVFDALGRRVLSNSPDAGESRALFDVANKQIRAWDPRGFVLRRAHDALQRPTHAYAQRPAEADKLTERIVYGETHPEAEARNLRNREYQTYDSAGVLTAARFDFKGNATQRSRRLAIEYRDCPDWSPLAATLTTAAAEAAAAPLLEAEAFATSATFDALNRVSSRTTPDSSESRLSYNAAGLLESVAVRVRGAAAATAFVTNVEYDAKGQRTSLSCGNGTITRYEYSPETFRLVRQVTLRATGASLQDVSYTHDPVGNIVAVSDAVAYGNPGVAADGAYEYDALYQLTRAEGREHPGQHRPEEDPSQLGVPPEAHPNDWQALRRYRERYEYDPTGNILELSHQPIGAGAGGWTRRYRYASDSNHLTGTSVPGDPAGTFSETYAHDAAGNMTRLPHLPQLEWDYANRLQHVAKQVQNGPGPANDVYFSHDATGQRVRKVYEHTGLVEERIYLDGYELYRRRNAGSSQRQLERQTLQVMDDRRRIALVETKTIDTSIPAFSATSRQRYQLENHLGSSGMELDAGANVISYEEYLPFGGTAFRAADANVDVSAKRYRYTGKERDEETGLYYVGARYYATWLARWISVDPIHQQQTQALSTSGQGPVGSPYEGLSNNPLRFIDPDGRQPIPPEYRVGMFMQQLSQLPGKIAASLLTPRVVGGIQTVGGGLELAGAGGLLLAPEPTMTTKVAGVALGAHGVDTLQAGVRTLWTGELTPTVTHQAGAAGARALGASPGTAEWVGAGADILASAGPAVVGAMSRRAAVAALETGIATRVSTTGGEAASSSAAGTVFRGTSEGFQGSPALQRIGITPVSQDPVVATVFATEAENYGTGVLYAASRAELQGVSAVEGNVLASLEREIGLEILPAQFAERAGVSISAQEARAILERMGHSIPATIRSPAQLDQVLRSTARLSAEDTQLFIQEARQIAASR